jgi:flavin-binding protein dodecin
VAGEKTVSGSSFESFEDAVQQALGELPAGPEDLRRARIDEFNVESGGFVGKVQYGVKLTNTTPE